VSRLPTTQGAPMPRSSDPVLADASLTQARKNSMLFRQLMRGGHVAHQPGDSIREADHKGHHIVIRTKYEVSIDGKLFRGNLSVANSGNVHYHAIPNVGFASAIDLVKCVIDVFPDEFPARPANGSSPHGDHGGHPVRRRKRRSSGK
jgi:hypothetical protein